MKLRIVRILEYPHQGGERLRIVRVLLLRDRKGRTRQDHQEQHRQMFDHGCAYNYYCDPHPP